MNAAPMHAADWIVCAAAFLVLIVATWWVLYASPDRIDRKRGGHSRYWNTTEGRRNR
jgi:hypothetical protein